MLLFKKKRVTFVIYINMLVFLAITFYMFKIFALFEQTQWFG